MEFSRSDFDTLNKLAPSGRINGSIDMEIYWFHAIAKTDAAFFQSRKMHRHKFFELHFILGGSITYKTTDGEIALKSGEYVLFAPCQRHKIESYSQSLLKCSAAFTVGEGEELYEGLLQKCSVPLEITEECENGIRFISGLSEKQTPYCGIIMKNRLFEIIHGIAGEMGQKKRKDTYTKLSGGNDMRIFKVKQLIKDNPHVFLGCDDMAEYCNLSVKQLNRLVLRHEGKTLLAYLHDEKLDQAKARLRESDSTLREISEDLGFSSVYYFCRFFQRMENMTPGEYRRAYKNNRDGTFDKALPHETKNFN